MLASEYKVVLTPQPNIQKIYLEITSDCNLECKMCFRHSFLSPKGSMSQETFQLILEQLSAFPELREVVIGGIGEPTIHPNFLSWVKAIRDKGYEVSFWTNGTSLTEDFCQQIIDLGVSTIMVSLDSPKPEEFFAIRGYPMDTILQQLNTLKRLKQIQNKRTPRVFSEYVLMKQNYRDLPDFVTLAARYGIEEIILSNMVPFTKEMAAETLYDQDRPEDLEAVVNRARLKSMMVGVHLREPFFSLKTERHCQFVLAKACVIGWQGQVSPCHRLLHTYREFPFGRPKLVNAFSYGNVAENSLLEIWTKEAYMVMRYKLSTNNFPSCPDCNFVNGCDLIENSDTDCFGNNPGCADCLWTRNLAVCP